MSPVRRMAKFSTLVVLGVAASGCVVLPFGAGHGRYGRGERHHYSAVEVQPIVLVTPQVVRPHRGGR